MKIYLKDTPTFSICEPYLTLFMKQFKELETRNYPFPDKFKGNTVLLHKPLRSMKVPQFFDGKINPEYENKGCITAIGKLTDCYEVTEEFIKGLSEEELNAGFYYTGRYAWKIENIHYIKPIKCRGHQSFFYYTGEVEVY